ncbi:MAG: M15 family metallopeptidase [Pseudomonadota bacterium]
MMPLWVGLYFMLACGLGAWVFFPGLRSAVSRQANRWTARLAKRPAAASTRDLTPQAGTVTPTLGRLQGRGRRWPAIVGVAAVLLLTLPALVVWLARSGQALPGFDDQTARSESVVVSALLQGEHLVAPPALPPSLFITPEVESLRPQLALADRRWDQFDPQFRQRLLWVYKVMKEEHGYDMVLLEGYRSPERQTLLSRLGASVTNAGAWQSYHQYGLAADSAFLRNGKLVISERDPWAKQGYEAYGRAAIQAGLVWGGRWQNADLGHVELRLPRKERP